MILYFWIAMAFFLLLSIVKHYVPDCDKKEYNLFTVVMASILWPIIVIGVIIEINKK